MRLRGDTADLLCDTGRSASGPGHGNDTDPHEDRARPGPCPGCGRIAAGCSDGDTPTTEPDPAGDATDDERTAWAIP